MRKQNENKTTYNRGRGLVHHNQGSFVALAVISWIVINWSRRVSPLFKAKTVGFRPTITNKSSRKRKKFHMGFVKIAGSNK